MTEIERKALLGDKMAQERCTENGVDCIKNKHYPYKNGAWTRNPKLYSLWRTMIHRCYNPKRESYPRYGGSGIEVCEDWKDPIKFMDWAEFNGYKEGLQIDRIDNYGNYCPENCRWVTPKENSRNKRNNVNITINGETKTVAEWCEKIPVSKYTVYWWVKEKGVEYAKNRLLQLLQAKGE